MHESTSDLSQIALVLAAAFAGGSILRRFGQPVIVGYIIVGMILGPSVLGLVSNDHNMEFLSELGILLLLFVIGLEMDAHRFLEGFKISVNTALLQIAGGLAAMTLVGLVFGWSLNLIVILGFAASLSSTAVALKMLEDMGETDTPLGKTTMGILVAQDLAVIPMLLVVSALDNKAGGFVIELEDIGRIAFGLAFMVVVIFALGGRDMGPFKFSRMKIPSFPDAGQTVLVALTVCFTAAALTGAIGLSASYGAFLAGLAIGSTHNHKRYHEDIRPIFELLLMIFFLSVGIMLDLKFMLENAVPLLTVLFVLLFLKTYFNITVLRLLGLSQRHAVMVGATLGQVGEFSFVLAALGLSMAAIEPDAYKFVVAIIVLSLVMTPAWTYAIRRMNYLRRGKFYRAARLRRYRQSREDAEAAAEENAT